MYITINNIIGEKTIDLSYAIQNFDSRKEIAVISMFSDNLICEIQNKKPKEEDIKEFIKDNKAPSKKILSWRALKSHFHWKVSISSSKKPKF